jgi:hypothetical protein
LVRRERSIIDGILTNESLTDGFSDEDAREVIEWSLAIGKDVARKTAGLDEAQAEKVISERMYANRKLMRVVKRLVVDGQAMSERDHEEALQRLHEQARIIYGDEALRGQADGQALFLQDVERRGESLRVHHVRQAFDPRGAGREAGA